MINKYINNKSMRINSLVFMLLFSVLCLGQESKDETYKFLNPSSVNNISDYITALEKSDMTRFRLENKSNVLKFESGLKIELFSAEELINRGISVNKSRLLNPNRSIYADYYVLSLSADKKTILQRYIKTKVK